MDANTRVEELGLDLPDYSVTPYYGPNYGTMKPHDQVDEAARLTAINCLAGIRYAIGDLNRVASLVRSLNFVVCTPDFYDVHKVSSGATDLFRNVFGEERGLGGRATIGVMSLARNHCFENWLTVEVQS